jgi:FMN-dependent NADH-azoreductase
MNILHVSCSPHGARAESSKLSRKIIGRLLEIDPAAAVVERRIGEVPVPAVDAGYAAAQHAFVAEAGHHGSTALSEVLIRELERADAVVIGTPMHNLAVPSTLKAWIDHVVRARRTFDMTPRGKVGTLRNRPVFVAVASGGFFSGERARQPDFLTPYLALVLGHIGLTDVTFFCVEGTARDAAAVAQAREVAERKVQAVLASFALTPAAGFHRIGAEREPTA